MGSNCGGGGGGGGGNPPVVRLVEPEDPDVGDPYVYGAERIFTVSVNQVATLKFYLDGTLVQTFPNVTEASQPIQIPLLGVHTVRVTATNARGSGENYWTWSVVPMSPVVTRNSPIEPYIVDSAGTQLIFTAHCDQSVTMHFYLDESLVHTSIPDVQSDSCSLSPSIGEHIIRAVGVNQNGSSETSWELKIKAPRPSLPLNITKIDPVGEMAVNRVGEQRPFSVRINHPAYVNFYLDGTLLQTSTTPVQEVTLLNATAAIGDHTLWVEAYTGTYWGATSWLWKILHEDSPVDPPIVEKISPPDPVTSFVGQRVSFQARINQPATIIITIDRAVVFESEQYTNNVIFPCSLKTAGSYSLTIIASNQNGQGQTTWSWTVAEVPHPPIITIREPLSLSFGTVKPDLIVFAVSVNQLCELTWIVDDHVVMEMRGIPLPIHSLNTYIFNSSEYPVGLHELKVRAVNENGSDEKQWVIKIIDNTSSTPLSFPTKSCSDLRSMIAVKMTPILKIRADGSRFFEISWTAGNRPQSNELGSANLLRATIRATVWVSWRPCIHEPDGHCTDEKQEYFEEQWLLSRTTIIEVPNDTNSFIVGVDAEGEAMWMQQEVETETKPPVIAILPIFNSGEVSCRYLIELQ